MSDYTTPKTDWTDGENVGDSGKAFNRIEKNVDHIKNYATDFESERTFNDGLLVNGVLPDLSVVSIDGQAVDSFKTASVSGYGNATFSASTFSASYLSNKSDALNLDWFESGSTSAVYYSHYKYDGGNNGYKAIKVTASQAGRGGATDCTIYIDDATDPSYPTLVSIVAYAGDLPSFGQREYYANLPLGAPSRLRVRQVIGSSATIPKGAEIRLRRAKYPIQSGQPVKVFNSDFSATVSKGITADDLNNNRLTS